MCHEIFAHCPVEEKCVAAASGEWSSAVMTLRTAYSYSNKSRAWEVREWIITERVTSATLSGRPGLTATTLASQFAVRFTLSILLLFICIFYLIFFFMQNCGIFSREFTLGNLNRFFFNESNSTSNQISD